MIKIKGFKIYEIVDYNQILVATFIGRDFFFEDDYLLYKFEKELMDLIKNQFSGKVFIIKRMH